MSETISVRPPANADFDRILPLSRLLGRPLIDRGGESLGRVADVLVRLRGAHYPLVMGMVAQVSGVRRVFAPVEDLASLDAGRLELISARVDLRHFERREGEVLLRADVLGHRMIDVVDARLVGAFDLELAHHGQEWVLSRVDVRRPSRLPGFLGGRRGERHAWRDWTGFEVLIGHTHSAATRAQVARIRQLKPAHIADLLEAASKQEQQEILAYVHADPRLEADVFEELDQDRAARLLDARTDLEIAGVIGEMPTDAAADTIAELPQRRRQPVLDLLPPLLRAKVQSLLSFNPASAGGLMTVDFLALPAATPLDQVIAAVRQARSLPAEALTSIQAVDGAGRLQGVAPLIALIRESPDTALIEVCDTDPVRVGPEADMVDVAILMADHNLTTIPVVDADAHPLGVITVDDVLEALLPRDWRRREPAPPPDVRSHAPHQAADTDPQATGTEWGTR
jgi:CBS domain-containing protein